MTTEQRKIYARKYIALQGAKERKYVYPVYNALRSQVQDMLTKYKSGGHVDEMLLNHYITPVLKKLYVDAGLENAIRVRSDLQKVKTKGFGTNDGFIHDILNYLIKYLLTLSVRSISETTKNWVLEQISKGVSQGLGAAEIAKGIEGGEFIKFQALRIVRTETVRASNAGAITAMKSSPFEVQKEWIAAHDNRTRHSHLQLDGQLRDVNEEFKPGLMQPGDPNAGAAETINCRCSISAIPKRDENGRLIRKPIQMPVSMLQAV